MLVRGKPRVGLMEVISARHQDEGLGPWTSTPRGRRAVRAGIALAGVGGVTLALMLSLGSGGPVLSGHSAAGSAASSAIGGGDVLAASSLDAKALEVRSAAYGQGERPVPEGLTLRPGEGDGADTPAPRVSLLPPADQGPAMRGEVTAAKPVAPASVKEGVGGASASRSRPAGGHEPEPPKVKARLIDASADKPLENGVNISMARP